MKRLTGKGVSYGVDVYMRLREIEDILGDEYDLDELRELVQAKREGRCVVLEKRCNDG